jgi:hypothetical protein
VYGLLGFVNQKQRINVDYSKTAAEVFWDAVAAFQAFKLEEPARIIELGRSMGVTGKEEMCQGLALEFPTSSHCGESYISVPKLVSP